MAGLAWSQLRYRKTRLFVLLLGLLVATSAFTVLTAASKTSQLRTVGTVSAHFVPAYDILVRPVGSRTALESKTDSVQPNFLSGIYGGITMAQYRKIAQIPGVQVAAPIAMVGYALLITPITFNLPSSDYSRPGRQLYRINTTWVSDAGTSRVAQPPSYLYVTPDKLEFVNSTSDGAVGSLNEVLPDGKALSVCPFLVITPQENPFGVGAQSNDQCWSKANGIPPPFNEMSSHPVLVVDWVLPVLIAAIDPVAEAELDGLDKAVLSGNYLAESAADGTSRQGASTFPVLASTDIGMDESAQTQLQLLTAPQTPPNMDVNWMTREEGAPARTLLEKTTTAAQAYQGLITAMRSSTGLSGDVPGYWTVGSVSYRKTSSGALRPVAHKNPPSAWYTQDIEDVSVDNEDNQYREVTSHSHGSNVYSLSAGPVATPHLVGTFDPAEIRSFDPLSEVPLGAYQPVKAAPADSASRKALHGNDLLPNENVGGYVSQPVNLVTTLSALPVLQNSGRYSGNLHADDPISVIRVRVAGVTGPDKVSLERIKEVAQQIAVLTHLDVDIVAGSSPSATTVDLPAGKFGQPALTLTENWVKKGVAVAILDAVDENSLVLFFLILVVCVLFVANSASAAIRARRQELGLLACLGWTRPRLFATVLGEIVVIGVAAGILGGATALPLSSALGLHASLPRALLAVPTSVAVAVVAGLAPAWLATRAEPVASIRPPVLAIRRSRHPAGVSAMAAINVLRTPGRALVAAMSLAIGITALTVLSAITFAYRGVLVGSLLGDAVAVQVRAVDYVAVAATITLGVLAVADVLFLNIRERAPEIATIRSFGWRESTLNRLVVTEGAMIGLVGSVVGAGLGLFVASKFAGQIPDRLYVIAASEVVTGVLVTACAALLPAQLLRRLPTARLLAEE